MISILTSNDDISDEQRLVYCSQLLRAKQTGLFFFGFTDSLSSFLADGVKVDAIWYSPFSKHSVHIVIHLFSKMML